MNFFQRRRLQKQIKQVLQESRHARHMREDIADPAQIEALRVLEREIREAWRARNYAGAEQAAETLIEQVQRVCPAKSHPRVREYVEILVVAVGVAMAFRTFFIQPFKIPTGSMEPTLYGIKVEEQYGRGLMDRLPFSLVSLALFGDRYVEIRAARTGRIGQLITDNTFIFSPDGVVPPFRPGMLQHFQRGDTVVQGQLLASGRVRSGDHIFVNKVRYNFRPPQRGDVFVFTTAGIDHPQVKPDTFYIKRLAGLPGERIEIRPPYLVVDGEPLREPEVFRRQVEDRHRGYHGYVLAPPSVPPPVLARVRDRLQLSDTEYLALGDNTHASLDGRYFGGVERENIVGPAVRVYWPLSPRWGRIQ